MVGAPSTFPTDRGLVDRVDKSMSSPFFSLLLPLPAEAILSVPGCFFGMPLFGLPGSLLQALAGAVTQGAVAQGAVAHTGGEWRAFGALFTALLCVWFAFLAQPANTPRSKQLAQVLYGKHTVVGAPLLAIFVMRALELESAGCGHFFLLAWYVAISPVLVIKAITRRRRPLASEGNCVSPFHTQIPMCSQFAKRPIHKPNSQAQFTTPIHNPNFAPVVNALMLSSICHTSPPHVCSNCSYSSQPQVLSHTYSPSWLQAFPSYLSHGPIFATCHLDDVPRLFERAADALGVSAADATGKKVLQGLIGLIAQDANSSFPSGDVAGAVAFAFPLWRYHALYRSAAACVVLSAFGRLYWQVKRPRWIWSTHKKDSQEQDAHPP